MSGLEMVYSFCSNSIGQKSITWSHLNARGLGCVALLYAQEEEEMILVNYLANLIHTQVK